MIPKHCWCNRGFPSATSLSACVLAARSVSVLDQVRLPTSPLRLPDSRRDSTVSGRTVMKNPS